MMGYVIIGINIFYIVALAAVFIQGKVKLSLEKARLENDVRLAKADVDTLRKVLIQMEENRNALSNKVNAIASDATGATAIDKLQELSRTKSKANK